MTGGEFRDSEIVVMLGENGTGKTTFIKMLAGLLLSDDEEKGHRMVTKLRKEQKDMEEDSAEWAANDDKIEKVASPTHKPAIYVRACGCCICCQRRDQEGCHPNTQTKTAIYVYLPAMCICGCCISF